MIKTVLAIDPGESIGYAIIRISPTSIISAGTIAYNDLLSSKIMPSILDEKYQYRTVIELFPQTLSQRMSEVQSTFRFLFPEADYISPGVYLPVMKRMFFTTKDNISIHAQEAVKLGIYYITYTLSKEHNEDS